MFQNRLAPIVLIIAFLFLFAGCVVKDRVITATSSGNRTPTLTPSAAIGTLIRLPSPTQSTIKITPTPTSTITPTNPPPSDTPFLPLQETPVITPPTPWIYPEGVGVKFTGLNREEFGRSSGQKTPVLVVVSNSNELDRLLSLVYVDDRDILTTIDFENHCVIGVFGGDKPSTGYGIMVVDIIRTDGVLVISTQTWGPGQLAAADVETNPYELVKLNKEDVVGITRYILISNGIMVFEITY